MARRNIPRTDVLAAIKGSNAIVSTVADRLGCSWETAKKYIDRWEETRTAYEAERQRVVDFAENKMLRLIESEDGPMIRFFLRMKAKDRGYVERQEITGKDGESFGVLMTPGTVDEDEWQRRAQRHDDRDADDRDE